MPNIEFEAGNEFANPADAVQAAIQPQVAPTPEPQPQPDVEAPPGQWADPQDQDSTAQDQPIEAKPVEKPFLEISVGKSPKRYDLDPTNEELKRDLALAHGARQWQRERDEARTRLKTLEPEHAKAVEKAKVWDELDALSRRGHREQVVRAVLGEEGYQQFTKQLLRDTAEYESADPETQRQIERERADRAAALKADQYDRKAAELQAKLDAHEDQVERTRLRSLGTSELKTHDFRGYVKDPDLANALNQKLWKLAWADLEDVADSAKEITPEVIAQAFASNAKVLRAGMVKQTEARVDQVIAGKKTQAVKAAQVAATERYPTPSTEASTGWDGRSSKDLLKRLVGARR